MCMCMIIVCGCLRFDLFMSFVVVYVDEYCYDLFMCMFMVHVYAYASDVDLCLCW